MNEFQKSKYTTVVFIINSKNLGFLYDKVIIKNCFLYIIEQYIIVIRLISPYV